MHVWNLRRLTRLALERKASAVAQGVGEALLGDALRGGGGRVLMGRQRAGRVLDSALALLPHSGGAQFTVGGAATGGASSGGGGTEGERVGLRERVESCGWREREESCGEWEGER
jgi:hypothetical protein